MPPAIDAPCTTPWMMGGTYMAMMKTTGGGTSTYAARALLLAEPPSVEAGEITDKGYINQRAVLNRRSDLVEYLYADVPDKTVITVHGAV